MRTVDSGPKWAQSWNQIQTLKDCLCCHIYCAQLGAHVGKIVGASVQSLIGSPGTLLTLQVSLRKKASYSRSLSSLRKMIHKDKASCEYLAPFISWLPELPG